MAVGKNHVVTGKVRLSYVSLCEPKPSIDGKSAPKYQTTVLLPKSDTETKAKIDAAINEAKQSGKDSKFGGKIPAILSTPIHDGDGYRPTDGEPYGEECKGCWVFTASTTNRPRVVDINRNDILDPTEIYSGMYARVALTSSPTTAVPTRASAVL